MHLKLYQTKVIESLSKYFSVLKRKKDEAIEIEKFMQTKGMKVDKVPFCNNAWSDLANSFDLPVVQMEDGYLKIPKWVERSNGIGDFVPSICLKIPTGGGKTILAASTIELLHKLYFLKFTGLYLWIVPSGSIYIQTLELLTNRKGPIRQILDKASFGRVRIFQKSDCFTKSDVENNLCILLLMLQASARKTTDVLKVFRDSGGFTSFFPKVDDCIEAEKLLKETPNLDLYEIDKNEIVFSSLIKQSLANVLKLLRPVIIIDEGHKAYSDTAKSTMLGFNPSFVLELSATPNAKGHHSNILVDVSGVDLKNEEMIKLPIQIQNFQKLDWKNVLGKAIDFHEILSSETDQLYMENGVYIRPIMLVRVERTGKQTRDGSHVHADDVKEFIQENYHYSGENVRIKSATIDEIGNEDLLSQDSKVRIIITKEALREGWDCPFAYVLTILSKTTSKIALTQMIGRILRQPYAKRTNIESLNKCYVFCRDQDVKDAVYAVRKGLEEEGMGDISSQIITENSNYAKIGDLSKNILIQQNKCFQNQKIVLPILSHTKENGQWQPFDYDQHIISDIELNAIKSNERILDSFDSNEKPSTTSIEMDADTVDDHFVFSVKSKKEYCHENLKIDLIDITKILNAHINNPWHSYRLVREYLDLLVNENFSEYQIYSNREAIINYIISDIVYQIDKNAKRLFLQKIQEDLIRFGYGFDGPKIELPFSFEMFVSNKVKKLTNRNGKEFGKCLYDVLPEDSVNNLEKQVAYFLENSENVIWWWRLIPNQEIYLTGWKRNRIYPDFVAMTRNENNENILAFLETKGQFLVGNSDTEYKRRVFQLFENKICTKSNIPIRIRLIEELNWKKDLAATLGML